MSSSLSTPRGSRYSTTGGASQSALSPDTERGEGFTPQGLIYAGICRVNVPSDGKDEDGNLATVSVEDPEDYRLLCECYMSEEHQGNLHHLCASVARGIPRVIAGNQLVKRANDRVHIDGEFTQGDCKIQMRYQPEDSLLPVTYFGLDFGIGYAYSVNKGALERFLARYPRYETLSDEQCADFEGCLREMMEKESE